ncbi:hypothetical protein ES703_114830 [subsurface metagenome]
MATFWTAIGAMLVPLGVLLVVEVPSWSLLAFCLIVVGLVTVIVGLLYTRKEEQQKRKESELRIRREKASLIVLIFMADALGVDTSEVLEMEEKHLDGK